MESPEPEAVPGLDLRDRARRDHHVENWDAIHPDGAVDKCSFNHYAFGCVGNFLYRRVLGIQNAGIGYDRILLDPGYGFGLGWAEGSYHSVHGRDQVALEKTEASDGSGAAAIKVSGCLPANTEAELVLPDGQREKLGNGAFVKEYIRR